MMPPKRTGPVHEFVRFVAALLFGAGLLAAPAAEASAQPGPLESPVRLEFTVNGGLLAPAGNLTVPIATAPPSSDPDATRELEIADAAAFGGGVGVLLPFGFDVEGQVLYAPGADLEVADTDLDDATVTDGEYLAATANLRWRLPLPLIQPYVGAGGGIRRLSFEDETVLDTDEETDVTGSVLAGTYVTLIPGWTLRAEVRDYISSFEDPRTGDSELQNDLTFVGGVAFRFP